MDDLIGIKFTRLLPLEKIKIKGKPKYICLCDCGNKRIVAKHDLLHKKCKSCGCLKFEINNSAAHGHCVNKQSSSTYRTWSDMIKRCHNPKSWAYKYYGARGIFVCPEWRDFTKFLKDMGVKPHGLTLDRIDNDKGYFKDNCRWATRAEQSRNRRPFSVPKRKC